MKRLILCFIPIPILLLALTLPAVPRAPRVAALDRSPSDLALSADGAFALSANTTANTVSLVDLKAGRVVAETPAGQGPFCIALARDGRRAVVTNRLSDSLTLFTVSPTGLKAEATFPVGDEPRGVALSPDGKTAYVALAGESTLAWVNLATKRVETRLPVGIEPWHVGLSPDGKRLAVGGARSQDVSVIGVAERKVLAVVKLRGHNVRHIAMSPDNAWAYVPNIAERGRPATKDNIDRGWVVGNRLSRVPLQEEGPREAIALDPRGKAVGDVDGVAVSPDGKTLAVTCGGTHELLLLRQPLPFIAFGGPGDHIEPDLLKDENRFRRVPLGGRPLGVAFAPDGNTVVVANYLSNALQVVDVPTAQLKNTVPLGGPEKPSLARQGEAIFLDADRSFHHWYSCDTCHVEGHTNGSDFDTFNDGSYGTPKKTLSLRGVTQTGPWTWHGWQKSLRKLVHDSMTTTMQGEEPTDAELDAVLAYLATLDFKPNPHRNPDGSLTAAAKRGEAVFQAKACNTCHASPNYTTPAAYVIGLEAPEDVYRGYNPPSLRGVYNRSPYLHTSAALTLEEVLTEYHRPSKLTGKPDCTPQELTDLIAFLNSL
ncbi:MAG TPA: beta-propeller fold lactonase family protein [Chthonomonadaceae bacterium]|nr:beta-propeller fold lactonase family protein [Chthonomonadaceae bacterium]